MYKEKIKSFFNNHQELCYILMLLILCILFIFANIGLYPLIDIDETRYVNMSKYMFLTKEYITPMLNFEPFLEKPPLYFWLNVIAFKILGIKTAFAGRFMTGLVSTIGVFYTYFFAKTVLKSRLYGFLSSCVLLTSAWFLVFSHVAILDLNFMVFSSMAVYSAILPLFIEEEKKKKYFWYLGYFFMALSVLAKGFIGLAVPMMSVFFTYLAFGKIKEIFRLKYTIFGFIILFLVALPWHILIYHAYKQEWINIYILKHHFSRLLNSEGLGRKQPFLFYLPIMLGGLIPWVFNFFGALIKDCKSLIQKIKVSTNIKEFLKLNSTEEKLLLFSYIYAICVFVFFSSASTKLPPYILTMFPPLSLIIGYFWFKAIKNNDNSKLFKVTNYINSIFLLTLSTLGLIFAIIYKPILPDNVEIYITNALNFSICALIVILICSIASIFTIKKHKPFLTFGLNILIMLCVIFTVCGYGIPYYTSFAQDELEQYAKLIDEQENSQTVTYGFSAKYSILNPEKKIEYIVSTDNEGYSKLKKFLNHSSKKVYIITRTKVDNLKGKKGFKKLKQGKVYEIYTYISK